MRAVKFFISFIAFVLIAAGFFVLIRFEISFGVAGGKFGGAEVIDMPGTFWFIIGMQAVLGFSLLVDAIKELWSFSRRNNNKSGGDDHTIIVAIYWLLAAFFFLIINCLAIWSAFELAFTTYKLLLDYEMPRRAILGALFLVPFGVFCYLYYTFLFRSLIETFYPKACASFQALRGNNK